ncbi:uncharacterized protein LOC141633428 [Silene latifolia]|uniref:uncharacterized protein LOC141633428 n=1 Tax=Silene latifolia TaxID=37657 RepID=UPI003D7888E0
MEASVKAEMMAYRATEPFKIRSDKSKINRASKGKNGKAPGTHTMGRLNSIQYMDKLCNEKGGLSLPRPEELMKKSKTKRAGGYVCDEVSELLVSLLNFTLSHLLTVKDSFCFP